MAPRGTCTTSVIAPPACGFVRELHEHRYVTRDVGGFARSRTTLLVMMVVLESMEEALPEDSELQVPVTWPSKRLLRHSASFGRSCRCVAWGAGIPNRAPWCASPPNARQLFSVRSFVSVKDYGIPSFICLSYRCSHQRTPTCLSTFLVCC